MEEMHKKDIEAIRQEMNLQFSQIMSVMQENCKLIHIANKSPPYSSMVSRKVLPQSYA